MTKKDYNVDNYSESELFQLFSIDSKDTVMENLENVDQFMKEFMKKNKDENIREFLQNAGSKILSIYISQAKSSSIRELVSLFQQNNETILLENIKQHASYVIDTKEGYVKLYLENVFQILSEKIAQRQYEMIHENENEFIEQFVYLDTRFRSNLLQSSNDSIFDLPETKEVVSLGLHNIEVPLTWKIFDDEKQNNFFLIGTKVDERLCGYKCSTKNYDNYVKFTISDQDLGVSGEPLLTQRIIETRNNSITDLSFNYRIQLQNKINKLQIVNKMSNNKLHIVFHDSFSDKFSKVNMNQTLGWKLGFRVSEVVLSEDPQSTFTFEADVPKNIINAETYVNIYPNSLYLQVDDFVTHSSEAPVILPTPKYTMTNNDLTYCLQKYIQSENIQRIREPFAVIDLRGSPVDSILEKKYLSEYHEDFEFKKSYPGPSSISKLKISIYDEQGELIDFQGSDFKLQLKLVKRRQPKSDKINVRDL